MDEMRPQLEFYGANEVIIESCRNCIHRQRRRWVGDGRLVYTCTKFPFGPTWYGHLGVVDSEGMRCPAHSK
jgi:hypothetical protein